MWYLTGLLICLAYVIIMPFVRYKEYWHTLIPTLGEYIKVWNTLFGHFLASIIPWKLNYDDYSQIVTDIYDWESFFWALFIILAFILLWIVSIPLTIIIITILIIKGVIERYITYQATKHNSK